MLIGKTRCLPPANNWVWRHRVGVDRDAVLATQAQSYMVLKEVGVIDLEATENIIKLVTIIVKNPAMIFKKFTN